MKNLWLAVLMALSACSSGPLTKGLDNYRRNYQFSDMSGQFILDMESGLSKENEVYVKQRLIGKKDNQEYERLIAISERGQLSGQGNKISVLRPKISQYSVWFENQKYFTQLEVLAGQKELRVEIRSPEKKWHGPQRIPFKNSRGVFCFFAQLADCVKVTGFLSRAIEQKGGKMSLTVIWESYPFVEEQYSGVTGPFALSVFSYQGRSREGDFIFNLDIGNQILSYHFNRKMQLEKKFWVSQGLTQMGI